MQTTTQITVRPVTLMPRFAASPKPCIPFPYCFHHRPPAYYVQFVNTNTSIWRHSQLLLLSVLMVVPSSTSRGKRIRETVSSPSDLGIRLGVSTGTSVDPWMVRPINGTLEEVAPCLVFALLSSHFSHRRLERHTRRCRRFSAQNEELGDHTISYAPHRQRYTGLV